MRKVVVLPGAVGAEKSEQLAAGDLQIDIVDCGEPAVTLGELDQSDHAILRTMASTSSRSASRSTDDVQLDGTSFGLRRKRLGQQGGRFLHAQLTRTGSHQRGRDNAELPVGCALPGGQQSAAHHLTAGPDSGSWITTWSTKGAARSPLPVTTAAPALSGELRPPLLGKTRARLLIQSGDGIGEGGRGSRRQDEERRRP